MTKTLLNVLKFSRKILILILTSIIIKIIRRKIKSNITKTNILKIVNLEKNINIEINKITVKTNTKNFVIIE